MSTQDVEFPLEEIARLPSFHSPVAGPDGDRIAYYYDGTGRNELYVRAVATGEATQVSDGEVPRDASHPIAWDAEGERILFHRDEGGDEQYDVCAIDLDGEVEELVVNDGQCHLESVGPDGRYLLYASTESGQLNLHRYDLETGDAEQITDYERPVRLAEFGPDGDQIAYTANETDDLENADVYVAAADGSDPERIDVGETGAETMSIDWSPDGTALLVADNSTDLGRSGVYDLEEGTVTWHRSDAGYDEYPATFLPADRGSFLATRWEGGRTLVVEHDLDGTTRDLALDDGAAAPAGAGVRAVNPHPPVVGDGDLLLNYTRGDRREELYRYDLDADESTVALEAEYGSIDPSTFVDAEEVSYESTDGTEIEALLYRPDGHERGVAPAIVKVHGGPHARAVNRFDHRTQLLVNRGYAVLQPNYRGSLGRGREFKNAIHGDWGGMEQEDVVEGGRWLKDRDWVDEDRVAVLGGSYGGYSAYMQLVTYPDSWATGAAWVGITDLHELFENSMPHFKTALREGMGDPEANHDLWRERSPIEHVEDIEAPILMVHGVNDPRCPVEQARRFRDALVERRGWTEGEDFVYEELDEEGHGSTDIEQRTRALSIVADYLDEWL